MEDKTFRVMIEEIICPFILYLREKHITCLTEFSGRRGIHVWILIEGIVSKNTAFILIEKLAKQVYAQIIENECFGLDLFPATGKGNNKYGKLVKIPLSVHRKGGQSFFIRDICSESIDEWLNYPDKNDFWEIYYQGGQNYGNGDYKHLQRLCDAGRGRQHKKEGSRKNAGDGREQ